MLPLDLHVLSLSLAFILSQDQTLRCWIVFFNIFAQNLVLYCSPWRYIFFILLRSCTTCWYVISFKELFLLSLSKRGCKGNNFYYLTPNIFQSFFSKKFFIFFSAFHLRYLSRLRVQKYCYKTYIPNIFVTFLQTFLNKKLTNKRDILYFNKLSI